MSDQDRSGNTKPDGGDSTGWIVLGVALVAVGVLLGAQQLGIVPWRLGSIWGSMVKARGGVGILLLGVLLIVWSQSGRRFTVPEHGRRLYRSRDDKWLAGVLGGLAEYFNVDATLLRLAFIALVVLFDFGALVVVYIVMAIIVPAEPETASPVAVAPAPAPAVAVAPPAPPVYAEPEVSPATVPAPADPATDSTPE